jgi:hypothetical protein
MKLVPDQSVSRGLAESATDVAVAGKTVAISDQEY